MRLVLLLVSCLWPRLALSEELTVAVASNFLTTAEEIVDRFEATTEHRVTLVHGSTGQLYAQIDAGAPYDIFLAADSRRPELLAERGLASAVRTYAIGRLILTSRAEVTLETAAEAFEGRTVALADPTVAPYGLAATAAMERMGLDTATFRPVLVTNVGQVATIFATGNADLAFISAAQLPFLSAPYVMDLDGLHPPIRQDAAILERADDNGAARAFWEWLYSDEIRDLIETSGYDLAE